MPRLYVFPDIRFAVNGPVTVRLHFPDTPFGAVTQERTFAQPDPWYSDADVLAVVQAAYPEYTVQYLGVGSES